MTVYVTIETFERVMNLNDRALPYIRRAHDDAEARHDELGGELYMDAGQWDIIQDTAEWMKTREDIFKGNPS